MASISKEYVSFKENYIEYEIKFSKKAGGFTVKIPDVINGFLGNSSNGELFDTDYEKIKSKFRELAINYWNGIRTERKVIAYRILLNYPKEFNEFGVCTKINRDDISFSCDYGLAMEYYILFEVKWNERTVYYRNGVSKEELDGKVLYCSGGNRFSGHIDEYQVIEWTEQLEEWFVNLRDNLKSMLDKIELFFGEDKTVFLKNICDGVKLISKTNSL